MTSAIIVIQFLSVVIFSETTALASILLVLSGMPICTPNWQAVAALVPGIGNRFHLGLAWCVHLPRGVRRQRASREYHARSSSGVISIISSILLLLRVFVCPTAHLQPSRAETGVEGYLATDLPHS